MPEQDSLPVTLNPERHKLVRVAEIDVLNCTKHGSLHTIEYIHRVYIRGTQKRHRYAKKKPV